MVFRMVYIIGLQGISVSFRFRNFLVYYSRFVSFSELCIRTCWPSTLHFSLHVTEIFTNRPISIY